VDVVIRPLTECDVADVDGAPVGFVAVRWTEEGATPVGEVEMIAVATGGDDGHAPARALYERHGFTGLPLVRYYCAL
jgi:hypothetical protein